MTRSWNQGPGERSRPISRTNSCRMAGRYNCIRSRPATLVIKQELLRVDQRPDDVLVSLAFAGQRFFLLLGRGLPPNILLGQSRFLPCGFARIGRQVKLAEFFVIAPLGVG